MECQHPDRLKNSNVEKQLLKEKSIRKSPLKDLKPTFEITENDLP